MRLAHIKSCHEQKLTNTSTYTTNQSAMKESNLKTMTIVSDSATNSILKKYTYKIRFQPCLNSSKAFFGLGKGKL